MSRDQTGCDWSLCPSAEGHVTCTSQLSSEQTIFEYPYIPCHEYCWHWEVLRGKLNICLTIYSFYNSGCAFSDLEECSFYFRAITDRICMFRVLCMQILCGWLCMSNTGTDNCGRCCSIKWHAEILTTAKMYLLQNCFQEWKGAFSVQKMYFFVQSFGAEISSAFNGNGVFILILYGWSQQYICCDLWHEVSVTWRSHSLCCCRQE